MLDLPCPIMPGMSVAPLSTATPLPPPTPFGGGAGPNPESRSLPFPLSLPVAEVGGRLLEVLSGLSTIPLPPKLHGPPRPTLGLKRRTFASSDSSVGSRDRGGRGSPTTYGAFAARPDKAAALLRCFRDREVEGVEAGGVGWSEVEEVEVEVRDWSAGRSGCLGEGERGGEDGCREEGGVDWNDA